MPFNLVRAPMKPVKLTLSCLGASTIVSALLSQPANAQYYGYGSDWRQPLQRGLIEPSRNESRYRVTQPLMRQPEVNNNRETPSNRGYGYSSGSYFGW